MATEAAKPAAKAKKPVKDEAPVIGVAQFVGGSAIQAVPVSGLLSRRPELADAEMTDAEWRSALSEYLTSPTT
jgi:hypothetical protein